MATQAQQKNLKALFDQSMQEGGLPAFRRNWQASLGTRTREVAIRNPDGQYGGTRREQYYDREADVFRDEHRSDNERDASGNWQVGEVFNALCGPEWKNSFEQFRERATGASRFEGVGGDVMPGDTPYVSAALDVVAGLLNARALARAVHPQWIWNRMCEVQEASGEGGFHIGNRLDPASLDGSGTDLAPGQMPITGRLISTRIHRNRGLRQARRMKVNYWSMKFDLTGQIMESFDEFTVALLTERERKVADASMGVASAATLASGTGIGTVGQAMPMIQDGLSFFPYQNGVYGTNANATTAAPENQAYVANFANCYDGNGVGLTNYNAIANALQIMHGNRDPFTKLPVQVEFNRMQFLVAPAIAATQLKVLLQQQALWQIAWGAALPSSISNATVSSYNLIEAMNLEIIESQYWMNRLVDAGIYTVSSTGTATQKALTNAQGDSYNTPGSIMSAFFMGHFKRALVYWQLMAYQTQQVPLGSVEYGEETVLVQDHREYGQVFWRDPRQVYRQYA